VTRASSASSGAIVSLAGLAVMTLPATVARLRICGAPTSQHARASGNALFDDQWAGDDLIVRDERAEMNPAVALLDGGQARDARQVDHAGRAAVAARLRTPRSISSSRSVAPARARTSSPYLAFR
jgi:hypothetical protein